MMGKKGFTLVELAVVIAVMTIILGAVITSYSALRREAVIDSIISYTRDFQEALQRFMMVHGRLPENFGDRNFVPDYFNYHLQPRGFRFVSYGTRDERCNYKPAFRIEVRDSTIPQALRNTLRICDTFMIDGFTYIVIQLTP